MRTPKSAFIHGVQRVVILVAVDDHLDRCKVIILPGIPGIPGIYDIHSLLVIPWDDLRAELLDRVGESRERRRVLHFSIVDVIVFPVLYLARLRELRLRGLKSVSLRRSGHPLIDYLLDLLFGPLFRYNSSHPRPPHLLPHLIRPLDHLLHLLLPEAELLLKLGRFQFKALLFLLEPIDNRR